MHVRKDPLFAVLAHPFSLDVVDHSLGVEGTGHSFERVRKEVEIDVRPAADMSGERAADQSRSIGPEHPHDTERLDPHLAEIVGPSVAFVQSGKRLDFVADLAIAGQILGFDPASPKLASGFHFSAIVLRFLAAVHQPGGFPGDPPPKLILGHN